MERIGFYRLYRLKGGLTMLYPIAFIAVFSALLLASAIVCTFALYTIYRHDGGKMSLKRYFKEML